MSEKENFDNKLANKFREAFDDYEAAYNPADWNKLQSKLHHSPFTSVWKNRYASSLAVAAGVSVLFVSYFFLREAKETVPPQYVANSVIDSSKVEQQEGILANTQKNQEIAKAQKGTQNKSENEKNNELSDSQNKFTIDKTESEKTLSKTKQQIETQNTILNDKSIQITQTQKTLTNATESAKLMIPILPISTIQIDSLILPYETAKPSGQVDLALRGIAKQKIRKEFPLPITFGVALNSLLYKNAISEKHAAEVGLNVSMPFANRLRLTAGILLAHQKMQYKKESTTTKEILFAADSSAYMPVGVGSIPRKNTISTSEEMNNDLLIVNIPIDVQYDFWQSSKARFFVSLGISNYLYLEEKARYLSKTVAIRDKYKDDDGGRMGQPPFAPPNITQNVTNSEVSSTYEYDALSKIDFFGGLNLSAGIEYQLSNHFSVQAAPLIRLPLKSIGHSKLTFNTFGMSVIVKYR